MATQVKTPTTTVDDASAGTIAWADPNNAQVEDSNYATQTFTVSATIRVAASIVKAGVIIELGQVVTAGLVGSSTFLWNTTITPTDTNNSGFGIVISGSHRGTPPEAGHYLKCTGYGFTIPSQAKVNGVSANFHFAQVGLVIKVDCAELTVYYQMPTITNVSTMTNISTITI